MISINCYMQVEKNVGTIPDNTALRDFPAAVRAWALICDTAQFKTFSWASFLFRQVQMGHLWRRNIQRRFLIRTLISTPHSRYKWSSKNVSTPQNHPPIRICHNFLLRHFGEGVFAAPTILNHRRQLFFRERLIDLGKVLLPLSAHLDLFEFRHAHFRGS